MKEFIQVTVGIILAFLIFLGLKTISFSLIQLFNIFGLIVIYFAIRKGEIFGSCLGAGCGLIQDAFSLGVFGVAGLSKTILGFLAGYIAKKIDVTSSLEAISTLSNSKSMSSDIFKRITSFLSKS